jgi:hypothetical protein
MVGVQKYFLQNDLRPEFLLHFLMQQEDLNHDVSTQEIHS